MKMAQLYVGSRYMYNNSTQKNLSSNNQTLTNEIYSYIGVTGMLGKKFNYSVSAGVNGNIFTTIENKEYKFVYFRPQVKLGYFRDESSDLTFNYEVNTDNPAVSSLTYNPYYKDANYLFSGNPNLKPSNNHDLSLSYFKGFKKFVLKMCIRDRIQATGGKSEDRKEWLTDEAGSVSYTHLDVYKRQSMAFALIEEAKEYGILQKELEVSTVSEALTVLNSLKDWEYNFSDVSVNGENSTLKRLINQRNEQKIELGPVSYTHLSNPTVNVSRCWTS